METLPGKYLMFILQLKFMSTFYFNILYDNIHYLL